jgi:hypothetical protein
VGCGESARGIARLRGRLSSPIGAGLVAASSSVRGEATPGDFDFDSVPPGAGIVVAARPELADGGGPAEREAGVSGDIAGGGAAWARSTGGDWLTMELGRTAIACGVAGLGAGACAAGVTGGRAASSVAVPLCDVACCEFGCCTFGCGTFEASGSGGSEGSVTCPPPAGLADGVGTGSGFDTGAGAAISDAGLAGAATGKVRFGSTDCAGVRAGCGVEASTDGDCVARPMGRVGFPLASGLADGEADAEATASALGAGDGDAAAGGLSKVVATGCAAAAVAVPDGAGVCAADGTVADAADGCASV